MTPCSVCKGPFHPSTGHEFPSGGCWCGPCTRDFIRFLKTQQGRRWGKVPFYAHACPPPAVSRFCECHYCVEGGRYVPVANDGSYGVSHGGGGLVDGPEWGAVGPFHGAEHVKAFWGCKSEADAVDLAKRFNEGYVPPPCEDCL